VSLYGSHSRLDNNVCVAYGAARQISCPHGIVVAESRCPPSPVKNLTTATCPGSGPLTRLCVPKDELATCEGISSDRTVPPLCPIFYVRRRLERQVKFKFTRGSTGFQNQSFEPTRAATSLRCRWRTVPAKGRHSPS